MITVLMISAKIWLQRHDIIVMTLSNYEISVHDVTNNVLTGESRSSVNMVM